MKKPIGLLGKPDLSKRDMREVVMQTTEPYSMRETTEILVKIIDSTYMKADLKQADNNSTQMKSEERTQLLSLLEDFEELFDGNLGDWDTDPVEQEINSGSELFNSKYYPVPRINKENFHKELKRLVKTGVLNIVKNSQYSTPIFIIPNKEGTMRFITEYRRLNQKLVRKTHQLTRI